MCTHISRHLLVMTLVLLSPQGIAEAAAFCGLYVSNQHTDPLHNDTSQVVLMRRGTTTVLSMRNDYHGPAKDFTMLVPVPVVLQKDDVKVLKPHVFETLVRTTSPRLTAYQETDPCKPEARRRKGVMARVQAKMKKEDTSPAVEIASHFQVGEFEVSILSAKESTALMSWLEDNHYTIPDGADEVLQSYISQGMYFLVARVDITRVHLDDAGHTMLSPLRLHYDSEDFTLPIRLGQLNADGPQDLIVHILARDRYEVANAPDAFIPTNLVVRPETIHHFATFYDDLFDALHVERPGTVWTEYAWPLADPSFPCDPCRGAQIDESDLVALGQDVMGPLLPKRSFWDDPRANHEATPLSVPIVATRLHLRYTSEHFENDLVFERAEPITGGIGAPTSVKGDFGIQSTQPHDVNLFQTRHTILLPWTDPITCSHPVRARWETPFTSTLEALPDLSSYSSWHELVLSTKTPGLPSSP